MEGPHHALPFGRIEVVLGPMFSGKSSEVLRRVRRWQAARQTVAVIKYSHDTRYADNSTFSTHDKATISAIPATHLLPLLPSLADVTVVAVDEGQFFPDIVEFAEAAANSGKVVLVAALDGDFRRKPFGRILELIPLAERVDKLNAVCYKCCSDEAPYSHRIVASEELELIGGKEAYVPLCRGCYRSAHRSAAQSQAPSEAASAAHSPAGSAGPTTPVRAASSGAKGSIERLKGGVLGCAGLSSPAAATSMAAAGISSPVATSGDAAAMAASPASGPILPPSPAHAGAHANPTAVE